MINLTQMSLTIEELQEQIKVLEQEIKTLKQYNGKFAKICACKCHQGFVVGCFCKCSEKIPG